MPESRFQISIEEGGEPTLLGEGAFGKVYKVLDTGIPEENKIVAIKQITKENMTMLDYI